MAPDFTSVPRPAEDCSPPARAREIVAVSFSPAGATAAQAWLRRPAGIPHRHITTDRACGSTLADIQDIVQNAKVGVRLVFSGPQADIYSARSRALASGAIDEEIMLLETDSAGRRVYCPHCKETTPTDRPVGAIVICSGCSRDLMIYHHFSRRTASYLGFKANAEEAP